MTATYQDKQLIRFDQTQRLFDGGFAGTVRPGKVVGAGDKASTDDTSYWNIELLSYDFKRSDINFADRFVTGQPVYVVLTNVTAPSGSSYSAGDVLSILVGDVTGSEYATVKAEVDGSGTPGYMYIAGNKCSVMSGSSGGCQQSILIMGTLDV